MRSWSTRPGIAYAGAGDDNARDRGGVLEAAVVLERAAQLVGEAGGAGGERLARAGDDLRVALDLLDRGLEPDVHEPLARVVEREAALLGEALGDALGTEVEDAAEDAAGAASEGEIRDVAEVAVEAPLEVRGVEAGRRVGLQ